MLAIIRKCCRLQIYFDTTLEEAEFIAGRSLDRVVQLRGGVDDPHSLRPTDNWREIMMPSYSLNRCRIVGGRRNYATLLWNFNGRFSNPKTVVIPYVCRTREEYERLESRPIPRRPAPPPQPAPAPTSTNWQAPVMDPAHKARLEALEAAQKALVEAHFGSKQP